MSILSVIAGSSKPFRNGSEDTTLPEPSDIGRRNEVSNETSTGSGRVTDGRDGVARRTEESYEKSVPHEIGRSVLTVKLFVAERVLVAAVVVLLTLEGTDGVAGMIFGVAGAELDSMVDSVEGSDGELMVKDDKEGCEKDLLETVVGNIKVPSLKERDDSVDNEVGVDRLRLRDSDIVDGAVDGGRGMSSGFIRSSSLISLGIVGAYKLSTSASVTFSGSMHLHSAV